MAPFGGADQSSAIASADPAGPVGMARLSKLAFDGVDLAPLRRSLMDRFVAGDLDAPSLIDLSIIEQLYGNLDGGLACQRAALELSALYRTPASPEAPSLRVLALAAPGDIGNNTPLEFLLDGSGVALDTLYVEPGLSLPETLPEFDVAIVAVSESDANRASLAAIDRLTQGWTKPVLNAPARVAALSRDQVAAAMQGIPGLLAPVTRRLNRIALVGGRDLDFPIIVRPVDSHAGRGLKRIDDKAALTSYLIERGEAQFFAAPYIDYRSADGLFRKYRIVFVEGRPFACHMAIRDDWMIYYLNAGMRDSITKREEEARFMRDFDEGFARRHAAAFAAIVERAGLDYFAIDCAELPDGTLLLFEADIAMIVHDMDPPDVFPYKGPQMRKVFDAFRTLLRRRAAPSS